MTKPKSFALAIFVILSLVSTSCSSHPDVIGTWTATPTRIDNISASSDASATLSISFASTDKNARSGEVILSAIIDANQPVNDTTPEINRAYEVSVAATAVISGHWSYEQGDNEDIVLSLDPKTLSVVVDPHGVTFSNDILTDTQQPMLDSLSTATATAWQKSIAQAFSDRFNRIQKISDIKVSGPIMSCEIHDRDFTFRRAQ